MNAGRQERVGLLAVTDPQSLRLMEGLARRFQLRGLSVHVVVGAVARPVPGGISHVIAMTRKPAPARDLWALLGWVRLLRSVRPQFVLVGTPKAGMLGIVAAALTRVPTRIYHLRGLRLETASGGARLVYTILERITMRLATHVVSVSQSLVDECVELRLAPRSKLVVLGAGSSNGVDTDHYEPPTQERRYAARVELGLPLDEAVVLFVGRMTYDKGLDVLARASAAVRRDHPFALVLVGEDEVPGYGGALVERLSSVGVTALHRGGVTDPRPYYEAADLLCLPSLREGFPNVVLEAAACAVPAVTTDATGCRDAVAEGQTGWLARVGDSDSLGAELATALADPEDRAKRGRAARRRVEAHFARARVQDSIVEYVETESARRGERHTSPI